MASAERRFENADVLCVVYGTLLSFSKSLQKGVLMWMTRPNKQNQKKLCSKKVLEANRCKCKCRPRMRAQRMRQSALAPTFQLA